MTIVNVIDKLREDGERITEARKNMVLCFIESRKPSKAKDVLKRLHKQGVKVHKTTVYRELDFLMEKGIINEVSINQERYFEYANVTHHHHLVCDNCGVMKDVFMDNEIDKLEKQLENEKNFKIKRHSLEFYGLCANCN